MVINPNLVTKEELIREIEVLRAERDELAAKLQYQNIDYLDTKTILFELYLQSEHFVPDNGFRILEL